MKTPLSKVMQFLRSNLSLDFQNQGFLYSGLCVCVCALCLSGVWQQKWISDDGYIYLSFVGNAVSQGEIAFNLEDKVDAATGFIWLLLLIGAEHLSPFETIEQTTIFLSLALILFSLILKLVRRRDVFSLLSCLLLFSPYFMRSFATSGLETPLIAFALMALHYVRSDIVKAAILGAFPFIRPELAIVSFIYLPDLLAGRPRSYLAVTLGVATALAVLRFSIFGDVVPNTAYAKLGLPSYGNGAVYAAEFLMSYPHVSLLLLALVVAIAGVARLDGIRGFMTLNSLRPLLAAAVLGGYVVLTGGDFMHGRFFLPAYVLLIIGLSDLSLTLVRLMPSSKVHAIVVTLCLALSLPLSFSSASFAGRESDNWWRGVMDERAGYAVENPTLHSWQQPNQHSWANEGRNLAELSRHIQASVGVARGGIGQIRFFSQAEDVYIYDLLSLTQVSGTLIDQMGRMDRPGHGAAIPFEFVYAEDRVTLFSPPDAELAEILSFRFNQNEFVLGALGDIQKYIAAGLLAADTEARVETRINQLLDAPFADTKSLLYLYERYPRDRQLRARIDEDYALAVQSPHTYPAWFESIRPILEQANHITRGEVLSFPSRYAMMMAAGSARPIKRRYAFRRYLDLASKDCAIALSDWVHTGAITVKDWASGTVQINASDSALSLTGDAILLRCGPGVTEVQILLQPIAGGKRPPLGYLIDGETSVRRFYKGRHHAPEAARISLSEAGASIRVLPYVAEGQSITLEVSAYAQ